MAPTPTLASLFRRRWLLPICLIALIYMFAHSLDEGLDSPPSPPLQPLVQPSGSAPSRKFQWANVRLRYPIAREHMNTIPKPQPGKIPHLQHVFAAEAPEAKKLRLDRLAAVRSNFTHAWDGYRKHAWLHDEVRPLTGTKYNPFGGWAASMVDALDTLWIMGLRDEFAAAVAAIDKIDFSTSTLEDINVFETTIRYLGGFLAAYDLSGGKFPALLRKAVELGDMLYVAFDTPNHLPITRWKFREARDAKTAQQAPEGILLAEIGSMTLEFTRLSQLSGDQKYYDVVKRVVDIFTAQQDHTRLPGLWPVVVNARTADFTQHGLFTIGGMADSTYEYLPKEYILLSGADRRYRDIYSKAVAVMKHYLFYRPLADTKKPILLAGDFDVLDGQRPSQVTVEPRTQHLSCFAGGMVALGSKVMGLPKDMDVARQLVEGCLWGYENGPSGLMPEIMHTTRCNAESTCEYDETDWLEAVAGDVNPDDMDLPAIRAKIAAEALTPGVVSIDDRRYILRPEAIESVFVLYRLTGDAGLPDRAWRMFETIVRHTKTDIAHAALDDCTRAQPRESQADRMESFWLAETLKYFYLMFSESTVVSLDEYVLNTEAHPLRWAP